MRRNLLFLFESFHGFLLILAAASIPIFLIFPEDWNLYFLRACILIFPLAATAIAVNYCSSLFTYLGIGIICGTGIFFFADNLAEQIYLTIFTVLIVIARIPARLDRKRDFLQQPHYMYSLFFLFIYIISSFLHLENLKSFLYYFAFVYIIIMILYINLKHLEYYLNDKKNVSNFPGHQIIYTNRIMVSIFAGITTFCFFLLPFTGLERLLSQIGNQFLALLRWLILLLFPKDSPEEEIIEETKTATEEQSSLFASEEQAPEWLVQLLQLFLNILLILAVLAFIAGIIYLIYQLFQRFYQPPHENEDQQEFIKEEHNFITRIRSQKDDSSPWFSFHPNAYIRKKYKKTIQKNSKSNSDIPTSYTPTELEHYANLDETNETVTLHNLYEKARYSKQGCTKEDAALIKKHQ